MTNATPGPLLLTIKRAAELLGLSEWQVRGLGDEGKLPVEKVGGRYYVPAKSVHEFAANIARTA